jgi:DNA polymerase-3 subunit gamma/tau
VPQQALYLKWRPLTFDDVIGQDHITRTLRNSLKSERIRHAYLFSGPRGTGKTTCARLLAKAVNCTHLDLERHPCNECPSCVAINEGRYLDLIEIDAATHTGVDDVRDLRDKIAFTPGEGRYKVYIIDEVHRFSGSAFDALLKTLEEPPDHAIFVLATTEIDKVPATIKSRCLQFEFRHVSVMEVADRLSMIAEAEGLHIERAALEVIARQGTGSVRDSISLLDQIVSDPEEEITLDMVQRILGTASIRAVKELVDALVDEDVPRGLHIINDAIDSGSDPRQFGQQVVEHLRAVMLAQTASADLVNASSDERVLYDEQAHSMPRPLTLRAIRAFNEAVNEYRGGWQPQLALELALIESIRGEREQMLVLQHPSPAPVKKKPEPKPAPTDRPPVETTLPGAPPVISPAEIQQRWLDMLKAVNKYSSTGASVLEHYQVHHVDGNLVYICTDNELYFSRLNSQKQKLGVVERALYDVHKIGLRVQVVLVDDLSQVSDLENPTVENVDDPLIMQGLELGGKIGGEAPEPEDEADFAEDD